MRQLRGAGVTGGRVTIGIDVGGTFVDCVVRRGSRIVAGAKAPATPGEPESGLLDALARTAAEAGVDLPGLLETTSEIVHGTTIGLNAVLTRSGGRVGLLATRGHEDAILIGRVHQKVAGLGPDEMTRVSELAKPAPLVPRWRIRGINERVDRAGDEVVRLDEAGVAAAARELVSAGCDAIAIAFLWSFRNPAHERRAAGIVREALPEVPVTISSDVSPTLGEYERTAATVVNAYLLRALGPYLDRVERALRELGFGGRLSIMLSGGGAVPAAVIARRPVETLRSGPAGGAIAAGRIARDLEAPRLLVADMGGTSFDVGLVLDGEPQLVDTMIVGRLHLAVPAIDVQSIGAGGGSLARVDPDGGLHVGPESAGAEPGPACYGRGGTGATVTDADLVLGRLDPAAVLGGRIRLDPAAAGRAVSAVGGRLGVDATAAAAGIVRVADARMADLIRKITIERGHDPREFALLAYGGAGPLHAGSFGPEVGVAEILVPRAASVFSALGLAVAEWRRTYLRSGPVAVPLDPAAVAEAFAEMERQASADAEAGGPDGALLLRREVDLRYRRQTHQVAVPLPGGAIDAVALAGLVERFERDYERIFGAGTAYGAAGMEATTFRVAASLARREVRLPVAGPDGRRRGRPGSVRPAPVGARRVYFDEWVDRTPVYPGEALRAGDRIEGPAVVDWATTTLVVHPGQSATLAPGGLLRLRAAA